MDVAQVAVSSLPVADGKPGAGDPPDGVDAFWATLAESLAGAVSPGPVRVDAGPGVPGDEPPADAPAADGTGVPEDEGETQRTGQSAAWVVVTVPAGAVGIEPEAPGEEDSPPPASRDPAPEKGTGAGKQAGAAETTGSPIPAPVQTAETVRPPAGEKGRPDPAGSGRTPRPGPEGPPEAGPIGERNRAERLWGFWARRGVGAGRQGDRGLRPGEGGSPGLEEAARAPAPEPASPGGRPAQGRGTMPGFAGALAAASPNAGRRTAGETGERPGAGEDAKAGAGAAPSAADAAASLPNRGPATASGSPEASRPHAGRPVEQAAQAVRLAVHRGGERVTVQLEPEHLGRIHVEVVREGAGLSAQIRVETPQAHQLLAAELPALRAAAEARQVPLIHVTVELDHGQGRGEGGDPGPRRRHRRPAAVEPAEDEIAVGTAWMPWGFEARI